MTGGGRRRPRSSSRPIHGRSHHSRAPCWPSGAATSPSRTMSSSRPRSVHRSAVAGSVAVRWSSPAPSSPGSAATAHCPPRDRVRAALVHASGASTSPRGVPCGWLASASMPGKDRDPATRTTRSIARWRPRSRPSSRAATSRWDRAADAWSALGWPYHEGGLDSARPRPGSRPVTGRPPGPRSTKRSGSPTSSEPDRSGTGRRTSPDGRASWLVRPAASPRTRRSSPRGSGKSWGCSPRAGRTARSPRRCSSARRPSRSTCRGSSTSWAPRPAAKPCRSRAGRGSWPRAD